MQPDEFGAAVCAGETHQQQRGIPAGHTPINGRIAANNSRTSASSSGLRRFGGVFRVRRTPDSARRTTSARPGAANPAAVWTWLIDDAHRDNDAAPNAGRPSGFRPPPPQ